MEQALGNGGVVRVLGGARFSAVGARGQWRGREWARVSGIDNAASQISSASARRRGPDIGQQ